LPSSQSPRILVSFASGYWRAYDQRSTVARALARSNVVANLTAQVQALEALGRGEVYAMCAEMTGGI
jgi:hypothetical protein